MLHTAEDGVLSNGLRYVTIERQGVTRVQLQVLIGVGAWHEPEGCRGISHLLEHMLFRGNDLHETQQEIDDAFDLNGTNINAATSDNMTVIAATIPPSRVAAVVPVICEMLRTPHLVKFDIEKDIVHQEASALFDAEGRPLRLIHRINELATNAYYGLPATGFPSDVAKLTKDDLRKHHAAYYGARNMTVVLAGPVTHAEARVLLEPFSAILPGQAFPFRQPPRQATWRFEARHDTDPTPVLALGFRDPSVSAGHPMEASAMALLSILGEGNNGRLFDALRGDVGLVYECAASLAPMGLDGSIIIHAPATEKALPEVAARIFAVIDDLRDSVCGADEIERVKQRAIWSRETLDDHLSSLASVYGIAKFVTNKLLDIEAFAAKLAAVDQDGVKAVATQILDPRNLSMLVAGTKDEATRTEIREIAEGWVKRTMATITTLRPAITIPETAVPTASAAGQTVIIP